MTDHQETTEFVDYYEVLEVSPKANAGALGRMFRYLAQRFHPDNQETGDRLRFDLILEAYNALKDPAKRTQYDIRYQEHRHSIPNSTDDSRDGKDVERDVDIQDRLLAKFYLKRRQNIREPGLSEYDLEGAFDCPAEHLEFHLWYLKAKGWISRLENGTLAITVEGVDHVNAEHHRKVTTRLLMDRNHTG
jgi:curved DNA-binding protein CbpA